MGKQIRGHSQFKDTMLMNTRTYVDYVDRFKKVAVSLFDWKNLPPSMDARFLEKSLYYLGTAALLKDPERGFINLKATPDNRLNMYDLPIGIRCWSHDFSKNRKVYMGLEPEDITEKDRKTYAILVMNNVDMIPTAPTLELFCQRLAEVQRTIDINVKAQKHPYLLVTKGDNQLLTIKNVLARLDDNEWAVITDENISTLDGIKCLDVKAPYVVDKLSEYKKEIFNETLTYLGISNIDSKKERMITSETDSKNELINLNLQAALNTRKQACKQFNELFGLKGDKAIDVAVRSDLHNVVKELENSFGGLDGRIELEERIKEEQGAKDV